MNVECSICCEILDNGQSQVLLATCDHVFHIVCIIRWLEKLPEQRNTCPHCLGSMSVSNLRIIRSNPSPMIVVSTNTKSKSKSKRLALVKCGIEFNNQSIIIANLERELADLLDEKECLEKEKKRLEEDKQRLIEENKRLDEEHQRLEEEKKRLDEEHQRLDEEMRRLEERVRFLEEQQRIEIVVVVALLMILFIGFYYCLKYKFYYSLM